MNYTPRKVWMITEYMTTVEDGREALDHETARPLAATFKADVAEIVLASLKERKSDDTIILSEINPLPVAVLKTLEEPEFPSGIADILGN